MIPLVIFDNNVLKRVETFALWGNSENVSIRFCNILKFYMHTRKLKMMSKKKRKQEKKM